MIRRAGTGDVASLATIEDQCFAHPWSAEALATTLEAPTSLVWLDEADRAAAAYVSFQQVADEAELLRIAVLPTRQRSGRAAALLTKAWPALEKRGVRTCYLEVRADNHGALALYRSAGFRETGRRARYYPDGGDALLLAKVLGDAIRNSALVTA